jgi:DNA-binding transcriptional LysR family regulator
MHLRGANTNHSMNWDDVRFFLAVARGGSIRRAASLPVVNHLVCVMPERSEFRAALWLVTHPELRSTLRIRSAFEFLEQHLAKELDLIEGRSPGPGRSRNLPDPHLPI